MNRVQAGCFSRVSARASRLPRGRVSGQGPTLHPCTPRIPGNLLPRPSLLVSQSRPNFTSKLPVKFLVRKATAFGCCSPSVGKSRPSSCLWPRQTQLPTGHSMLSPLSAVGWGLGDKCGWRSGRQWTAEEDESRENLTLPSDAIFHQSLESTCWIFVFHLWEENIKILIISVTLFLRFGVRCWCVWRSRGGPSPADRLVGEFASRLGRGNWGTGSLIHFEAKKQNGTWLCLPSMCLSIISVTQNLSLSPGETALPSGQAEV